MARVYVGMSGGVDSSVAAALLVEQGHEVTGVYMKNWSQDLPGMKCPWAEDLADAKRVAVALGIDFKVYDFEAEYRDKVVQYMIDEYSLGRTPNPDIMCNQEVKFRLFLDTALSDGAEQIATGHYARIDRSGDSTSLLQAVDEAKDQTYFLYRVTSEALSKTVFPLGDYTKAEVRQMAIDRKLWTADKRESMGVCFVGQVGMRDFLSQYVQVQPGDIIDRDTARVVGRHDGAIFYTLGQRHGLDVGGGLPYYVVGKDMPSNVVFVSRNLNDGAMWRNEFAIEDTHWINQPPQDNQSLQVRTRHRAPLVDCRLEGSTLNLARPERAVTPGQSAVIYSQGAVLGGGVVVA